MNGFKQLFLSQIVRYSFVGVIGTIIHTGVLWILAEKAGVYLLVSSTIGFLLSLLISYYLNSILTFKKKFNLVFLLKYSVVSILGLLINLSILFTFEHILNMDYMIGQIISIFVVPIFNFLLNRYWAFNSKSVLKEKSGGIV